MRLSLSNRLALVFFAITLLAVGALYLYVAPGPAEPADGREAHDAGRDRAHARPAAARRAGSSTPLPRCAGSSARPARSSGDRVTLLSVNRSQGAAQLSPLADSGRPRRRLRRASTSPIVRWPSPAAAQRGPASHGPGRDRPGRRPGASIGRRQVGWVVVYSAPLADVMRTVSTVRHEILVAGGIALLLALVAGYLVARALAQRVKRLELAARRRGAR